jgi:hypothetical protein
MRVYGLWLGLLFASAAAATAQVAVEVKLDQQQFLPGESLPVAVRIVNRSGQTLNLGADPDWLSFALRSREGAVVQQLADVPVAGEFELESSKVATKRVDLAPYFADMEPGRYEVLVTVRIRSWNHEIVSQPKAFDVIEGAKLWEREVGVPKAADAAPAAPEIRKYILQQANYVRGELRLYLRVTDVYGRSLRVQPIGKLLSFSRPEPQVDKNSNLHLLYQSGPQAFTYIIFNLLGQVVARQTHDYVTSRPRLVLDEEGVIVIAGGNRRVSATDIPPPPQESEEESTAEKPAAAEPAKTNAVAAPKL